MMDSKLVSMNIKALVQTIQTNRFAASFSHDISLTWATPTLSKASFTDDE